MYVHVLSDEIQFNLLKFYKKNFVTKFIVIQNNK